ncbi:MAG: AraC family transcriptional regulator [Proteobacteria bacterium]|nr:AraC family transcriptional regulator [Pseudomonadota bacterium]
MDVLSDVLKLLRLNASVYFDADFCSAWTISTPDHNKASFHIIERGTCWLHVGEEQEPITLRSGDLLFFPRNIRHMISDSNQKQTLAEPGVVAGDKEGPTTRVVCGYFEFESNLINPILNALPEVVHIKNDDPDNAIWLESLLSQICRETEMNALGSKAVIDKLSDVLFVQIIRCWINKKTSDKGFLAALADPKISSALQYIHQEPSGMWTVESLAQKAQMSRSAFAKRFNSVMGSSPMHYLAHWRMQKAYELLSTTNKSVAQIAEQFNYQSEASFSKAFKQHMNIGPGAIRRAKNN